MLFISHTWRYDEEGRNTHNRVKKLVRALKKEGANVWLDEEMLKCGNIDSAMADGIDSCTHFVACLTIKYISKVNNGLRESPIRDNCAKEFNYAIVRGKPVIPLVFESAASNHENWPPGVVSLFYANNFQLRAIDDEWTIYARRIIEMVLISTRGVRTRVSFETKQRKLSNKLPEISNDRQLERDTPRQSRFICLCRYATVLSK